MGSSQLPLGDFAPTFDPTLSQWHSSPDVCRRLAAWLPPDAERVLEPSAGGGNIVAAVLAWGATRELEVDALEIDPRWCAELRKRFDGRRVNVAEADFKTARTPPGFLYDAAIMNPPLDDGQGPIHVERALWMAKRVISVLTAGDMHNQGARKLLWRRFRLARLAHLGRWKVGGSSLRDFVAVDVRAEPPGDHRTEVVWWDV